MKSRKVGFTFILLSLPIFLSISFISCIFSILLIISFKISSELVGILGLFVNSFNLSQENKESFKSFKNQNLLFLPSPPLNL